MFTCPTLPAKHGFFGREGGKSSGIYASLNCGFGSGDDVELVAQNRAIVAAALGAQPESLITAFQIHSARVVAVEKPWAWKDSPEADALVTATPGVVLGILTADCQPVLFSDPKARIIGAAHAGWKGAMGGIIEATMDAMIALGAREENIRATIGPSIAQASYEVGAEFKERFEQENSENNQCFIPSTREGHFLFDLTGYTKNRLKRTRGMQINALAHDTCLDENRFFSYRRTCLRGETAYGRQISAITLQD